MLTDYIQNEFDYKLTSLDVLNDILYDQLRYTINKTNLEINNLVFFNRHNKVRQQRLLDFLLDAQNYSLHWELFNRQSSGYTYNPLLATSIKDTLKLGNVDDTIISLLDIIAIDIIHHIIQLSIEHQEHQLTLNSSTTETFHIPTSSPFTTNQSSQQANILHNHNIQSAYQNYSRINNNNLL